MYGTWWSTARALPFSAELLFRFSLVELLCSLSCKRFSEQVTSWIDGVSWFDFWIKLDFGHFDQVLRPVRFNHTMLHNGTYFLALLMSLSIELM